MKEINKKQLFDFIRKGRTEDAIKELALLEPWLSPSLRKSITLLSRRYYALVENQMKRTIAHDDAEIELNKINEDLFNIIEALPEKMDKENLQKEHNKKKKRLIWLASLAGIVLVTAVALIFFQEKNEVIIRLRTQDEQTWPKRGEVRLQYNNISVAQQVNNNGDAIFSDLAAPFFDGEVKVSYEGSEKTTFLNPDASYAFSKGDTVLVLLKKPELLSITGVIRDKKNNALIEKATLTIEENGQSVLSKENGDFTLAIPDTLTTFSLTVEKSGFETLRKEIPVTKEPLVLFLQPQKTNGGGQIVTSKTIPVAVDAEYSEVIKALEKYADIQIRGNGKEVNFSYSSYEVISMSSLNREKHYFPETKIAISIDRTPCRMTSSLAVSKSALYNTKAEAENYAKRALVRKIQENATEVAATIKNCLNQMN